MGLNMKGLFEMIILVVVASALTPTVASSTAAAQASLSGASATLMGLVPLFYVIAIIVAVIGWAVYETKGMGR